MLPQHSRLLSRHFRLAVSWDQFDSVDISIMIKSSGYGCPFFFTRDKPFPLRTHIDKEIPYAANSVTLVLVCKGTEETVAVVVRLVALLVLVV